MATVQNIDLTLERDIKGQIQGLLNRKHIPWIRMNSGSPIRRYKGHKKGTADLQSFPRISRWFPWGHMRLLDLSHKPVSVPVTLWIETKRPGETQTADQIRFEQECLLRGHAYLLADSIEDVERWLEEHGAE